MSTPAPSDAETRRAERTAAEVAAHAATSRTIFGDTTEVDLPGIGRATIKYRNPDLAHVERTLSPLLEDLPDHLRYPVDEATGRRATVPHANVWDAIEILADRWPLLVIGTLLEAGLRHAGIPSDRIEDLPPSVFTDASVQAAVGDAIRVAFGAGPSGEEATAGPTGAA